MAESRYRQADYRQRPRERGLVQMTLWAPARDADRIRRHVERLVKQFEKEQTPAADGGSKEG
jgi:hypothetical protein